MIDIYNSLDDIAQFSKNIIGRLQSSTKVEEGWTWRYSNKELEIELIVGGMPRISLDYLGDEQWSFWSSKKPYDHNVGSLEEILSLLESNSHKEFVSNWLR